MEKIDKLDIARKTQGSAGTSHSLEEKTFADLIH